MDMSESICTADDLLHDERVNINRAHKIQHTHMHTGWYNHTLGTFNFEGSVNKLGQDFCQKYCTVGVDCVVQT